LLMAFARSMRRCKDNCRELKSFSFRQADISRTERTFANTGAFSEDHGLSFSLRVARDPRAIRKLLLVGGTLAAGTDKSGYAGAKENPSQ
jgi:hypothetical protein